MYLMHKYLRIETMHFLVSLERNIYLNIIKLFPQENKYVFVRKSKLVKED